MLEFEAVMAPGALIPPHIHLHQQESWEVLAGTGTFTIKRRRVDLGVGEKLNVPARTAHAFRNRTTTPVRVRAQLTPALRSEDLFERLFELGARGKVNRIGAPGPLPTARLIREFRDEFFYLAYVPVALQRLLAGTRP